MFRHGALGYIENGKLHLPESLLKPLSITHETVLFGLYYPLPSNKKGYPKTKLKHDFILSLVPFRLWPIVGRLSIRLKNRPGMVRQVSHCITRHEATILLTEYTRSGFRYDTWNLTISFDSLLNRINDLNFNEHKSYYKESYQELQNLRRAILRECRSL